MSAADTGSAPPCHRIDLVNKDNAGAVLLGFLEHVTHTACTDADKHFHKIRSGNGIKRNPRFTRYCLCKQRFSGSGSAFQKDALRNPCPQRGVLRGILQKIHDFFQIRLLLLQSRHILKCDTVLLIGKLCAALPEIHHLRVGTAASHLLCTHHIEEQQANHRNKKHRQDACHEPAFSRNIVHHRFNPVLSGQLLGLRDVGRIQGPYRSA